MANLTIEDLGAVLHTLRVKLGVNDVQLSLGRNNQVSIAVFIPVGRGMAVHASVELSRFRAECGVFLQRLMWQIENTKKHLAEQSVLKKDIHKKDSI